MQLSFNPTLLCVLSIISHRPSFLVQLGISQTKEHTEIQFCKMQGPSRLYFINCIYFFPYYIIECNTSYNFTGNNKPKLLNMSWCKCNYCFNYRNKIMTNTYTQFWSTRTVFLWNHYHLLLHVIEKFKCAKL